MQPDDTPAIGGSAPAVAAVVTAFRPGDRLLPLVRALLAQTGSVVVVDDGSGPSADDVLGLVQAAGADVIRHDRNRGIAAALNTGLEVAWVGSGTAPEWFLTVDQDSVVTDGFVAALVSTAEQAAAAGVPVGLVAPARVEGLPSVASGSVRGFAVTRTPIQSGLLIPVATVRAVGRFTTGLFIDGVDTDYGLRVARAGLVTVLAPGAALGHSLGDRFTPRVAGRPVRLGGEPLALVVSRPFRYYYLVRNRILLNRMHGAANRRWTLLATLADLRHCAIVLAVAPGRRRRLAAMRAGLRDGWRGRGGRIPARLEQRLARRA